MKGIESVPIKLILTAFLLLMVVWVGLYQMDVFLGFNTEKDFKQGLGDIVQSMKIIKSGGDYGAFTSVQLSIPKGFGVTFNIDSDTLTGHMGERGEYEINLTRSSLNMSAVRCQGNVTYNGTVDFAGGSSYSLMMYYGELEEEQVKSFTVLFK